MSHSQGLLDVGGALRLVEDRGVVLEAAGGPVATLTHEIVGERIRGSWWAHPASHHVYAVLRAVRDCPDVLVFRLVRGKVTYVHHRLWPALARLGDAIDPERLAAVQEVHTDHGHHRTVETPFPEWVDDQTAALAASLDERTAREQLGPAVLS